MNSFTLINKDIFNIKKVSTIILSNILLILSAYLSIFLPFSPVPITLQTLALFIITGFLGKTGFIVLSLYILEGIIGFPVFAYGKSGIIALLGPTGGYISGFVVAGFLLSYSSEKLDFSKLYISLLLMITANIIIYTFGILHLNLFFIKDLVKSLKLGVMPFVIGDAIKIVISSIALLYLHKIKNMRD